MLSCSACFCNGYAVLHVPCTQVLHDRQHVSTGTPVRHVIMWHAGTRLGCSSSSPAALLEHVKHLCLEHRVHCLHTDACA